VATAAVAAGALIDVVTGVVGGGIEFVSRVACAERAAICVVAHLITAAIAGRTFVNIIAAAAVGGKTVSSPTRARILANRVGACMRAAAVV